MHRCAACLPQPRPSPAAGTGVPAAVEAEGHAHRNFHLGHARERARAHHEQVGALHVALAAVREHQQVAVVLLSRPNLAVLARHEDYVAAHPAIAQVEAVRDTLGNVVLEYGDEVGDLLVIGHLLSTLSEVVRVVQNGVAILEGLANDARADARKVGRQLAHTLAADHARARDVEHNAVEARDLGLPARRCIEDLALATAGLRTRTRNDVRHAEPARAVHAVDVQHNAIAVRRVVVRVEHVVAVAGAALLLDPDDLLVGLLASPAAQRAAPRHDAVPHGAARLEVEGPASCERLSELENQRLLHEHHARLRNSVVVLHRGARVGDVPAPEDAPRVAAHATQRHERRTHEAVAQEDHLASRRAHLGMRRKIVFPEVERGVGAAEIAQAPTG
mmetsp:Transcript_14953/g.62226  ORF Transcript_14953/g.62226 Transcript_14953/m.62226 type:complete len:390 (+) Transcript_14953:745-1914(+)